MKIWRWNVLNHRLQYVSPIKWESQHSWIFINLGFLWDSERLDVSAAMLLSSLLGFYERLPEDSNFTRYTKHDITWNNTKIVILRVLTLRSTSLICSSFGIAFSCHPGRVCTLITRQKPTRVQHKCSFQWEEPKCPIQICFFGAWKSFQTYPYQNTPHEIHVSYIYIPTLNINLSQK